jgi:DNA-binding MarR family transcriptional regulator
MEESDLTRREPDPRDARSAFATVTPAGRALARKARRTHHAWLQRSFGAALDDRDVDDLTRIMRRIDAHQAS